MNEDEVLAVVLALLSRTMKPAPPVAVGQPIYPTIPDSVAVPMAPGQPARPNLQRRMTRMNTLKDMGWPLGLTNILSTSIEGFPVRFVVVDNSGSMQSMDGSRLVRDQRGALKSIASTRWAELGDVICEMADVASALGAATHFHLLNPSPIGQYFALADDGTSGVAGAGAACAADTVKAAMKTSPGGTTPLTEHVQFITSLIAPSAQHLRTQGQKAVVVLATDGLPNDPNSFLHALQELQRLPVWLVVRLCTNEEHVVKYWSDIDAQLEAPLETLDDVHGEAQEVYEKNPWLTYAPSLHLARTMGLQDKLFDLLDEQSLLPSQAKTLIEKIVGCKELPEPEIDQKLFFDSLRRELSNLPPVYNPVFKTMKPWIDVSKLQRLLNKGKDKGDCIIS